MTLTAVINPVVPLNLLFPHQRFICPQSRQSEKYRIVTHNFTNDDLTNGKSPSYQSGQRSCLWIANWSWRNRATGIWFKFFDEDEEGVVREGYSEFPYLLILIKLCPGNWKTQLKRMNQKVDEENGKSLGKDNVWYRNVCRFSRN